MIANNIRALARERAKLAHGVTLISSEVLESTIDDRIFEYEVMTESAKFTFLPRFKTLKGKYPELAKYEGVVNEAQMLLLQSEGTIPSNFGPKCAKTITTILGILFSIESVLLLPFCIFIFPIIDYLLMRLCVWACEEIQFSFAEKQINTTLQALIRLKNSTTDKKLKSQCETHIKKLEKEMAKIQKSENTYEKKEQIKKNKAKSYRRESVEDLDEDDIDFMAEFEAELHDVDVDELVTRLGTVPDTTDEEVDRIVNSEDPRPFTADKILLGDDDDDLSDEEIKEMMGY